MIHIRLKYLNETLLIDTKAFMKTIQANTCDFGTYFIAQQRGFSKLSICTRESRKFVRGVQLRRFLKLMRGGQRLCKTQYADPHQPTSVHSRANDSPTMNAGLVALSFSCIA